MVPPSAATADANCVLTSHQMAKTTGASLSTRMPTMMMDNDDDDDDEAHDDRQHLATSYSSHM